MGALGPLAIGVVHSLQGDNYLTCPTPSSQLLIGASYQRNNNGGRIAAPARPREWALTVRKNF